MKEKLKKVGKSKSQMGLKVSEAPKTGTKMKKGFSESQQMAKNEKAMKGKKGMRELCR